MCGPNLFFLREKLGVWSSFLFVWYCARGGFMASVSVFPICSNDSISSVTWCLRVTQLVSGFLSEGIALCGAVWQVYPQEERSSGASWVTILPLLPLFFWNSKLFLLKLTFSLCPRKRRVFHKLPLSHLLTLHTCYDSSLLLLRRNHLYF